MTRCSQVAPWFLILPFDASRLMASGVNPRRYSRTVL